jgi:tetratricopeptide (TPR) repeat protein
MPPGDADFYRSLLAADPSLASVRAHLAQSLLAAGDLDGAIAESSKSLAGDPALADAWLVRATACKARCRYEEAAGDFERAAALLPGRPMILVNLATSYAELGRLDDAEHCLRRAVALAPDCREAHASLGSVLLRQGRLADAEAPCRAALALDPRLVCAHQNLSAILAITDPAAARAHRHAAYRRQQVFIVPAGKPERRVLVLTAADAANVPLQHLMPRERTTLIQWYVEYATEDQDRALPPFDLVFNAIGDADLAPAIKPPVARLLRERAGQVLNDPARVALTRRCDVAGLLAGIPGVVVPQAIRHDGAGESLAEAMTAAAMQLPVLVRPLGSHGGEGVRRIDTAEALAELPRTASYLTQFVDYASGDGWYRKYRVIFVDGRPYPYHLAISRDWLVHYWTAGMQQDAARREEERRFLADPAAAIGSSAMTALGLIGTRLGLDYAGIDFGILRDGAVVVFEANATMLVHPERDACFAYREAAVARIQAAFDALLVTRARPCAAEPPSPALRPGPPAATWSADTVGA